MLISETLTHCRPSKNIYRFGMFCSPLPAKTRSNVGPCVTSRTSGREEKITLHTHARTIARRLPSKNIYSFVLICSQIPVITRSELTGSMTSRTSGYHVKLKYGGKNARNRAQSLLLFPLPIFFLYSVILKNE